MKKFLDEFKAFIAKGNVVDMAVAVIIGGAFGKIVTSLVNDIIMPLISLVTGGISVADWKWVIAEAVYDAEGKLLTAETALNYGNFIQTVIDFLIIAFCIFVMLKIILTFKSKFKTNQDTPEANEEPSETTDDILRDIRDALKK